MKKCPIIYLNPFKEYEGGGELRFQRATKGVPERRLACTQSYRCYVQAVEKTCFEKGPGMFQRGTVVAHTKTG